MAVTMQDIKHLRDLTGAGMMDVKKALEEAGGDQEKAMEILRKKGQAIAAKRSDREASEGCVLTHTEGNVATMVALKCETDFVAKNEDFIKLTKEILNKAVAEKPASLEALLALQINGQTIEALITERSGVTGEKMEIGSYEQVSAPTVAAYVHAGNKLGVVVGFNEAIDENLAKEIAMQIASMNPVAVDEAGVPENIKQQELEIAMDKARQAGKPENLLERIAQGSLEKYYKDNTLLKQEFVFSEEKKSVGDALKAASKSLTVTDFKRFNLNQD
ncbi:MAG: translation elongation factor Ts [Bacteroidales bacterium]|uniref:translation elongation factor Ts n=1 Tax=Porphyromonas sp. TaxID=1924944 RepID=UPI00297242ED|nr:translation elongation factor Ts [Porphyromonas sp.]MDD7438307.1 translation elongation factor Ts [Bacteroidales bacterium]MDY3066732.1 translation elongation factor Ts [Porphyromonas sp.]